MDGGGGVKAAKPMTTALDCVCERGYLKQTSGARFALIKTDILRCSE